MGEFLIGFCSLLLTSIIILIFVLMGLRVCVSLFRAINQEILGIREDKKKATNRDLFQQKSYLDEFARKNTTDGPD